MIRVILGIVGLLLAVAVGLYMGVWWAFIGGICQVIATIRAENLVEIELAIGVAKIFLAGLIGLGSAIVIGLPSFGLFSSGISNINKKKLKANRNQHAVASRLRK